MSTIVVSDFTNDQLELIKSTVAKGATNDELKLFLYRCKNMGLDPLKPGQVHFVKYGNNPGSIIVGIDGIRAKASRTGKLAGIKRGVILDDEGRLVAGWCEVYRSDWLHPIREEVPLSEYNTGKAQWATKPQTMLKKVAEAAALRMAFPDDLGGIYSEEEIQKDQVRDVRAKELTAQVQETTETPEFEASDYFNDSAGNDVEPTGGVVSGAYIPKAGKHKGTALSQIPLSQLNNFVTWYDSELTKDPSKKFHADVVEYYEKALEFLQEASAGPVGLND